MKKATSLLLVLTMVLFLFAGCGKPAAKETTAQVPAATLSAETAAPATESTTEPTLSPEELLYNSLTDRQRQAVDLGIVELSLMEDLERIVTVGEASAMLQKAHVHRTGVESKMLNELMTREEYSSRNAPRGWLMGMPGLADLELTHGEVYENYEQWLLLTGDNGGWATLWAAFDKRFGAKGIIPMENGFAYNEESDTVFADAFNSLPVAALDFGEYVAKTGPNSEDLLYHGLPEIIGYAFKIYDDTNGKKFMELEDGYIHPYREITLGEMAEHALCYYNFPNPMACPEYVAPEEVGTYNTDIITAELLAKNTDLPEASCQHLPQWHGVVMDDMELLTSDIHLDDNVYEYGIKAVKDAGFNYICLNLDFNWLQDYQLFNFKNNASTAFKAIAQKEDDGKLSVERLEKLDQVLAWCMENDIHLNLRANGVGGFYNSNEQNMAIDFGRKGLDTRLAQMWQAVARRYTDIPNTYLSFTLFGRPDISPKNNLLLSVDVIREVSPNRCIIAEIYGWGNLTAEPFAEKGVALSFKLEEPSAVLNHSDYYDRIAINVNGLKNPAVIDSFTWPHQAYDAVSMLSVRSYGKAASCVEVMAVAEHYGVGFMLGEFVVALRSQENTLLPRTRYSDDAYQAMILDITSAVSERGYGWCFANWYGYFGIANAMPIIKNTTYEQVEDYPYYIDQTMLGWFQEINGVQ